MELDYAFPMPGTDHTCGPQSGMTLRDYFAGQALAGLASLPCPNPETDTPLAYRYADAMLAARKAQDFSPRKPPG